MEKSNILSATIIAAGIVVLGICLKSGIDNFVNKGRNVEVKGLAEREVEANKVTWPITIKETGNDLQELYSTISKKTTIIKRFLKDNGVKESEIFENAPSVTDYMSQGSYNQNSRFRYTISASMTVVSKEVNKIRSITAKQGELLSEGVAIVSESEWNSNSGPTYEFTDFKEMKPEMVAEAIENAQKTAEQFARNSHSEIDKIVTADQGYFEIEDRDENTPYIKNIRVVTHITYSLKN